jgi:hypothetical protein
MKPYYIVLALGVWYKLGGISGHFLIFSVCIVMYGEHVLCDSKLTCVLYIAVCKGKAIPLTGPEGP